MRKHRNDDIKYDVVLGRAIAKYGWDNFSYEILEESDDKYKLLELEVYYIEKYNSKLNGYNMTIGGEKMFGEHNPFYGKVHSKETRKKLSDKAKLRKGELNSFFGNTHSQETIDIIIDANNIKVSAYDDDGMLVNTFDSGKLAGEWCRENGLTNGKYPNSDIFKRCKDGKKSFGYYWKYFEEDVETRE